MVGMFNYIELGKVQPDLKGSVVQMVGGGWTTAEQSVCSAPARQARSSAAQQRVRVDPGLHSVAAW